jgi:hypothetical protein
MVVKFFQFFARFFTQTSCETHFVFRDSFYHTGMLGTLKNRILVIPLIVLYLCGCTNPKMDEGSRVESESGTVSSIQPDGSVRISLHESNGQTSSLSISPDSDVTILKGNMTISCRELSESDEVLVTWSGGTLRVLQVLDEGASEKQSELTGK